MFESPGVLKFCESGAAPCRGVGSDDFECEANECNVVHECDPVDSDRNGEFMGENALRTEISNCRLSMKCLVK